MPTVAFMTLGCKANQFETDAMMGLFSAAGYDIVPFDGAADIFVINTCSVTALSDCKSRRMIRRAHKRNPAALIAVVGCYAQMNAAEAAALPGVMVVVGREGKQNIVNLTERALREKKTVRTVTQNLPVGFERLTVNEHPGRTRAFLKIEDGCQNFCSYCIIPYARGPVRSLPLSDIRLEVAKIAAAGFAEIVLTGIHIGMYGRDLPGHPALADVCREILAVPEIKRLRLGSLESPELDDDLLSLMADEPRIMRHLHLPLQSGSDAILGAMNRHYTTADYASLVQKVRTVLPNVAVSTDIIVGFPGETEELFADSLNFAESQNFSRVHVFPYSKRRGTPAAVMNGQVSPPEKKERVRRMQRAAERMSVAFRDAQIGGTAEVLWETFRDGFTDGLTENYVRVYARGKFPAGTVDRVRLTEVYADGVKGTPVFSSSTAKA